MSSSTTIEGAFLTRIDGTAAQSSYVVFPMVALFAPADEIVFKFNYLEQVSGLVSFAANTEGTTVSRTLAWEFRWMNQGGSFSSWTAATSPNLAAASVDEDLPLYIELRATRGGADTSGFIGIHSLILAHSVNISADSGFGRINLSTLRTDLQAFWIALLQSWVIQYSGADHYEVKYEPREWVTNTKKPIIYLHTLERTDESSFGANRTYLNFQMRVGIKPLRGATVSYNEMLDRLQNLFDPIFGPQARHTFDFKGVSLIGVSLQDCGIRIEQPSGDTEFHDSETMMVYNEFTASFSVNFLVLQKDI